MGRPLRIEFEDGFYHITSRGNERKKIFLDDYDRKKFLEFLKEYHHKFRAVFHCFLLMDNHYHLLLETPAGNLTAIMHAINSRYTGYFNRKYHRSGHLFQGRYLAILVDKEAYLLELSRYVHLNPVRAGMCALPQEHPYSSYPGYISAGSRLDWVEYDWTLSQFGSKQKKPEESYERFVLESIGQDVKFPVQSLVGGVLLGGRSFVNMVRKRIEGGIDSEISEGKELSGEFIICQDIMERVAKHYGITVEDLKRKKSKHNLPRKAALYFAFQKSGLSNKEIADLFGGVHYSCVSQTINRIRDDKEVLDEIVRVEKKLFTVK